MDGQGSRTAKSWNEWVGQSIDGFQLLQYLGGSDHSAVLLTKLPAQDSGRAAIKLLPAGPDSAEILSRWETVAELSHPHLVRLYRTGRAQLGSAAVLYAVMEYAQEDLSQILPERPLAPAEAQEMLVPLLEALAFIHGKGFVHGHIKPSNIMAMDDCVKIASDGLSRVGQPGSSSRQPSAYDAPETATAGMAPAADVWSLGVTLVECLTQRFPAWEEAQQPEPAVPDTLPQPFFDIARNCLRRDPQRRWTVDDIAARLQPAVAVRESPAPKPPKAPTKRPHLALTTVIVVVLAVLALPRLVNHHPQPPQASSSAPERPSAKTTFVPGAVLNQVVPDVPEGARDTIRGTVRVTVKVAVDPSGNVTQATLDSPGPSRYFADLALNAARAWKFRAPAVHAQNVASEWILRFQFARTGTNVVPVQAAP